MGVAEMTHKGQGTENRKKTTNDQTTTTKLKKGTGMRLTMIRVGEGWRWYWSWLNGRVEQWRKNETANVADASLKGGDRCQQRKTAIRHLKFGRQRGDEQLQGQYGWPGICINQQQMQHTPKTTGCDAFITISIISFHGGSDTQQRTKEEEKGKKRNKKI